MSTITLNLDWLPGLLKELPRTAPHRKSIFDITRRGDSELTVSNVLAFYFDKDEEHGLQYLFFRSLVDLLLEKEYIKADQWQEITAEETEYDVAREWYTGRKGRGFIDIVLTGSKSKESRRKERREGDENVEKEQYPWAILIENKIHASAYNRFELYEDAINADRKVCVYLALTQPSELKGGWCFISHEELIRYVRDRLPMYFDDSDDRHLLLLKDYFYNLERHTMADDEKQRMQQIKLLHKKQAELKELDAIRDQVADRLAQDMDQAMKERGFKPHQKTGFTDQRWYYPVADTWQLDDEMEKRLCISMPFHTLLDEGKLELRLELLNKEATIHGQFVRDAFEKTESRPPNVVQGSSGKPGGNYFYILTASTDLPDGETIGSAIGTALDATFFNKERAVVPMTIELLKGKFNNV